MTLPWLDHAKIAAIFAVLMVHVADSFLRQYTFGSEYWWIAHIYSSAIRWCVPVFVMVSGALLLDPTKKESVATFYRKRLSKIMIPTIFWSLFFVFIWVSLKAVMGGPELKLDSAFSALISGQPYYHLWFLYMILGLYLFTPFFRMIVAQISIKMLWLFTGSAFVLAAINAVYSGYFTQPFTNWFLMYIPYFFAGHLIRISTYSPLKSLLWLVFLCSLSITCLSMYISSTAYFYGYLSITIIPMSISIMFLLKTWQCPMLKATTLRTLATLSFGVYLIHPIILEVIHYHGHKAIQFHPALAIPALTGVVFMFSLAVAWIIYHITFLRRVI